MNTLEAISTRRSIKGYKSTMPEEEKLNQIIKAGLEAASGRNLQAPIILKITNKEIRDKLSKANADIMGASSDPFYNAPAVLIVIAPKSCRTRVYDGSVVMGNMMLAAHELGLGSCWIHRAKETFELPEWQAWLCELGLTEEYEGIGNLIVGYRDSDYPAPKPRREGRVISVE